MSTIAANDFHALAAFIQKECGIEIPKSKHYLFEARLNSLKRENGCDSYLQLLELTQNQNLNALKTQIINALTTNETYWFRDENVWRLIREVVLDNLIAKLKDKHKVRIWSAGCSTGQEPYSLAMSIIRHLKMLANPNISAHNFEILATDISSSALFIASSGRYNAHSMSRGIDLTTKMEFFDELNNVWQVKDCVKDMVKFEKYNLQDSFGKLGVFDFILCRNVLIYFAKPFKDSIIQKFSNSLINEGLLVLGASEVLDSLHQQFKLSFHENSTLYTLNKQPSYEDNINR